LWLSKVAPTLPVLPDWLVITSPRQQLQPKQVSASIGAGEHSTISLALELRADRVIIDELPGRRLAMQIGIEAIGTVGLLLAAKRQQLLELIRPELDRLRSVRFFMDEKLYRHALDEAGE
jgi:predicted nucleic acid-binding protein